MRLGPCVLSCALAACTWLPCEAPSEALPDGVPRLLSQTGLYTDVATASLADDVMPYAPRFELWSDGADKERYVLLPPGSVIDNRDPDVWSFPVGTKFFKSFERDGVLVETRMLHHTEATRWEVIAYLWDDDLADAEAAPLGVLDARGTGHDVPTTTECRACHGGAQAFVLGFSTIQLGYDAPSGLVDLATLAGRFTAPIDDPIVALPGSDVEQQALGYLHANCSHCHNQRRPEVEGPRCFDPDNELDFALLVAALDDVERTPTYRTAIGRVIERGRPDDSELIVQVSGREVLRGMPQLGTEIVDRDAVALLRRWIEEL